MLTYLETERVVLRRFRADDADLLVELDSDPQVMRYVGDPTPRDVVVNDHLPAFLRQYERGDGYGFWAAVERSSGEFLGWFHLRPRPGTPPDEPELGYRLRRDAWGKGYATEVSRALVRRAFEDLGARRVVASTDAANLSSRRVMEKSGMTLEREYWSDEYQTVDVAYAIERDRWEQTASAPDASG